MKWMNAGPKKTLLSTKVHTYIHICMCAYFGMTYSLNLWIFLAVKVSFKSNYTLLSAVRSVLLPLGVPQSYWISPAIKMVAARFKRVERVTLFVRL